jgi:hypothetical protein
VLERMTIVSLLELVKLLQDRKIGSTFLPVLPPPANKIVNAIQMRIVSVISVPINSLGSDSQNKPTLS